jgi:hypothetical protein
LSKLTMDKSTFVKLTMANLILTKLTLANINHGKTKIS